MDELRLVRRDDQGLIVASESGQEFRLIVDDTVLSEIRHLGRRETNARVRPREIQALIRAGRTRAEVAEQTGLSEADIERYEEPVLAERRYVLERAHAVPVRTTVEPDGSQQFGDVISERLVSLNAEKAEWSSWRDEDDGWLIALDFASHDIDHRAIWSFDHRKGVLSPLNPDASTLSRQGEVGDRLIPRLRAVDSEAPQQDRDPADAEEGSAEAGQPQTDDGVRQAPAEGPARGGHGEEPAEDERSPEREAEEYERRREIDQRAISTGQKRESTDFGQTADLLDALRRRRGERERAGAERETESGPTETETPPERPRGHVDIVRDAPSASPREDGDAPAESGESGKMPGIWAMSAQGPRAVRQSDAPREEQARDDDATSGADDRAENGAASESSRQPGRDAAPAKDTSGQSEPERQTRGRRRASIPSWDDILFGTKSDEDPR